MRNLFWAITALTAALYGQTAAPVSNAPEMATQDAPVTFRSNVNNVLVPVVVRDRNGKIVSTLRQEDFQLFDRGKLQTILKFSVEKTTGQKIPVKTEQILAPVEMAGEAGPPSIVAPDHFVAYLFDDIHSKTGDLIRARLEAEKHLATALTPSSRVAIYTTSGQTMLDFTDDRPKIHETLLKLMPRPVGGGSVSINECPDISFYLADRLINTSDNQPMNVMIEETISCAGLDPADPLSVVTARKMVESAAMRALSAGETDSRIALITIGDMARRMAAMPGKRVIVLVSPGFVMLPGQRGDETAVLDRAIKANVVINSIDIRGLYTDMPDISKRGSTTMMAINMKAQLDREASRAQANVMAELASGTGGSFYENTNDLAGSMRQAAEAPEAYYLLAFSPQNMKLDGGFHALKVTLKTPAGMTAKARLGYYAPRRLSSADEQAKEEISQALFSREEVKEIPIDLHTQFFKTGDGQANLTVISRVSVKQLPFRKEDGRNRDEVMIVSGLFDRNGNYQQGFTKLLTMRLRDETLESRVSGGVVIRTDFKVSPGTYFIRVVARDAEGQMMAAQNVAVEIPY